MLGLQPTFHALQQPLLRSGSGTGICLRSGVRGRLQLREKDQLEFIARLLMPRPHPPFWGGEAPAEP